MDQVGLEPDHEGPVLDMQRRWETCLSEAHALVRRMLRDSVVECYSVLAVRGCRNAVVDARQVINR